VVVIPFPFSYLTGTKRRLAFIVVDLPGDDCILCQITSVARLDPLALPLTNTDFISGALPAASYIRPNKIFTADKKLVLYTAGHLCDKKIFGVINAIVSIIQS
jgi:mRNA interferase MazF